MFNGAEAEAGTLGRARPGETVQAFLRRVTRPWHDAVEAVFAPFDLATAEGLGGFLLRQAAIVLPLEHALETAGVAALLPDWRDRRRSDRLAADLHRLGLAASVPARPVHLASTAHALGSLYVLEGSKLGGRVLLRRVLASPDLRVREACTFLGHHQPGGWSHFVATLNAGRMDAGRLTALRNGAESAFALFHAAADDRDSAQGFMTPSPATLVQMHHA